MPPPAFERSVFINCPFDEEYAPLLEAALFCVVYFGFSPRLANERLEDGENRLDKIIDMIRGSMYSIHDLSHCKVAHVDDFVRMNMPFEFGIDVGFRRGGIARLSEKKFLIFEKNQYDLKRSLSDTAGQDVQYHRNDFAFIIRRARDFFRVEADYPAPGPSKLISDYATFQGWMTEKKIFEGHSETETVNLPTKERLDEMKVWVELGKPSEFVPPQDP